MKALLLSGVLLAAAVSNAAVAQQMPRPVSLPDVTLDCYQSFATKIPFPDSRMDDGEFPIDGDNFDKPLVRYRLQVVDQTILKVVKDPTRPAHRKEHGVRVSEMMRDFSNKHQIVGWREKDQAGGLIQYIVNFDDLLFSRLEITSLKARIGAATLNIMKCQKAR